MFQAMSAMKQVVHNMLHGIHDMNHVIHAMNYVYDDMIYRMDIMHEVIQDMTHDICDMSQVIHGILHRMNDPVRRVLDVSQKMHELRGRLEQLDAERAAIQAEIAACMEQLAYVAGGQVMPPPDSTLSAQILWVLRRQPDRPLAPMDIAGMLDIRDRRTLTNIRVLLSRMGRDGRARKVAHGRYKAIA